MRIYFCAVIIYAERKSMETLKQIRKKFHMNQVDAAKVCGVSRRTYQEYEEKQTHNDTFDEILAKLKEMGISGKGPALLNIRYIKQKTSEIFAKYSEVRCAYLFGSYARGEARVDSDVDIVIVEKETMGLKFYGLAAELDECLGKEVDLHSHRELSDNDELLARILTDGVKIYGPNFNKAKSRVNIKTY